MQSNGIEKRDNWERFMQLSNAARIRNQGLAGGSGIKKSMPLHHRSTVSAADTLRGSLPLPQTRLKSVSYVAEKGPVSALPVLGGKFDSYA